MGRGPWAPRGLALARTTACTRASAPLRPPSISRTQRRRQTRPTTATNTRRRERQRGPTPSTAGPTPTTRLQPRRAPRSRSLRTAPTSVSEGQAPFRLSPLPQRTPLRWTPEQLQRRRGGLACPCCTGVSLLPQPRLAQISQGKLSSFKLHCNVVVVSYVKVHESPVESQRVLFRFGVASLLKIISCFLGGFIWERQVGDFWKPICKCSLPSVGINKKI